MLTGTWMISVLSWGAATVATLPHGPSIAGGSATLSGGCSIQSTSLWTGPVAAWAGHG